MKRISIVLPIYNEKDNISKFIKDLKSCINKINKYKFDIIISDSHSSDGTDEIVEKLTKQDNRIHYIDGPPGIGMGIYNGIKFALKKFNPNVVIQIDGDGQVDPVVIFKLIGAIEEGYDLAIGSRFITGGRNYLPLTRKLFSFSSSFYCRVVMGPIKLREFTNSTRAFSPALLSKIKWTKIPLKSNTFITIPAQLHEALEAGAKYTEVPLVFKNRPNGYSKNKIIKYSIDLSIYALKIRIKKIKNIFEK